MNPFRELFANYRATKRLKVRFQWLAWCVGAAGGALGLFLWYHAVFYFAERLNIPLEGVPATESLGIFGLLALLASMVVFLGVSSIAVAVAFGLLMVCLGQMTLPEAWGYALLSRYPRRWFRWGSGA